MWFARLFQEFRPGSAESNRRYTVAKSRGAFARACFRGCAAEEYQHSARPSDIPQWSESIRRSNEPDEYKANESRNLPGRHSVRAAECRSWLPGQAKILRRH